MSSENPNPENNVMTAQLQGRIVIIKRDVLTGTNSNELSRLVKCIGGNGCDPKGLGRTIFIQFLINAARIQMAAGDAIHDRITRADIERFANAREIANAH